MGWSTKDLREDLKVIKNLYKMEKNPKKKEELLTAMHTVLLNIADIEAGESHNTKQYDIWRLFNDITCYDMYYPFLRKYRDRYLNSEYQYEPVKKKDIPKCNLTENDVYDLLDDFYKSTPKGNYRIFSNLFKDRDKYINYDLKGKCFDGITYMVPIVKKNYMSIGAHGDKRDLLETLTHEYGHAIGARLNDKRYYSDDTFVEIESLFMSLIGIDYYHEKTNDEYFKMLLKKKVYDYAVSSQEVLMFKNVHDNTFRYMKDNDSALKLCDIYLEKEGFNPNKVNIDIEDSMKYIFSYMVAIELYEVYKEDKELAFNLLKKIVNRDKRLTEYESITNTVTPVKSLNKYMKRLYRS